MQLPNEGEDNAFVSYWRRQGIKVSCTEPTNRIGLLESHEMIKKRQNGPKRGAVTQASIPQIHRIWLFLRLPILRPFAAALTSALTGRSSRLAEGRITQAPL
jgi:hypothetical protein